MGWFKSNLPNMKKNWLIEKNSQVFSLHCVLKVFGENNHHKTKRGRIIFDAHSKKSAMNILIVDVHITIRLLDHIISSCIILCLFLKLLYFSRRREMIWLFSYDTQLGYIRALFIEKYNNLENKMTWKTNINYLKNKHYTWVNSMTQ